MDCRTEHPEGVIYTLTPRRASGRSRPRARCTNTRLEPRETATQWQRLGEEEQASIQQLDAGSGLGESGRRDSNPRPPEPHGPLGRIEERQYAGLTGSSGRRCRTPRPSMPDFAGCFSTRHSTPAPVAASNPRGWPPGPARGQREPMARGAGQPGRADRGRGGAAGARRGGAGDARAFARDVPSVQRDVESPRCGRGTRGRAWIRVAPRHRIQQPDRRPCNPKDAA